MVVDQVQVLPVVQVRHESREVHGVDDATTPEPVVREPPPVEVGHICEKVTHASPAVHVLEQDPAL